MTYTSRPPGYELFFAPLLIDLNPSECENIHFAYVASKYGHAKQVREDGSRYFDHPKSAAWIYIDELKGRDPRLIVVLLLHDLSEDAYLLSSRRISLNFGRDIGLDVRAITRLPKSKETTEGYLMRVIIQGPWTITAKLCDRLHNVRTLGNCTPEKQLRKIKETRQHYLPMLIPKLREFGAPWKEYADLLEAKINKALDEVESHLK